LKKITDEKRIFICPFCSRIYIFIPIIENRNYYLCIGDGYLEMDYAERDIEGEINCFKDENHPLINLINLTNL